MNRNTGTPVVASEGSEGVQSSSLESVPQVQITVPLRPRCPPPLAGIAPARQADGRFHPRYEPDSEDS